MTAATSGVGMVLCSPAGGDPLQSASCCCHWGMVKYGQTRAIPGAVPVRVEGGEDALGARLGRDDVRRGGWCWPG